MALAKTLMISCAIASLAAPALAGGWGGRYGVHVEHNAQSYEYSGEDTYGDGGYHAYGGGYSRREVSAETGWHYRDLITGREFDGPPPGEDGPWNAGWTGERWRGGCGASHWVHEAWVNGRLLFHREGGGGYGAACGGATLPSSFFSDGGGVGGFVDYGGGGGGGGVVFAGAGASAHASAFASASARISIRSRGGHGGRGGKGCGCGGGHGGHH